MSNHRSRVLVARWIIPVSSPPVHGGWVRILDGRIAEVGGGKAPAGAEDWGDVAILPRLVNAHTHLEFSDFQRPVGEHGISIADWIGLVVASRASTTATEKQKAIDRGLTELWDTGSLLAGEITTPPCVYPQGSAIPRLVTFAEVLGLSKGRADERLAAAIDHVLASRDGAFSPHAPYSVSRDAMEATLGFAQKHDRMVAMHVAESPEERELLSNGSGPLAETLIALGVWQHGLFPWGADPYCQLIERLAAARSVLLVHGNDLNEKEVQVSSGPPQCHRCLLPAHASLLWVQAASGCSHACGGSPRCTWNRLASEQSGSEPVGGSPVSTEASDGSRPRRGAANGHAKRCRGAGVSSVGSDRPRLARRVRLCPHRSDEPGSALPRFQRSRLPTDRLNECTSGLSEPRIRVTSIGEKGSDTKNANHPLGRSGSLVSDPFSIATLKRDAGKPLARVETDLQSIRCVDASTAVHWQADTRDKIVFA